MTERRPTAGVDLPIRVAACTTHPIQYQAPIWRRLARCPELDLRVYFGSSMGARQYHDSGFGQEVKWDVPILEGYAHKFVAENDCAEITDFWTPSGAGMEVQLTAYHPRVIVITAYSSLFHLRALYAAARLRAGVVMRHEASDVAQSRSRLKGLVRDMTLRLVYSGIDRFAVIGAEACRHLSRLNVSLRRMDFAPYCVDTDMLAAQRTKWLPHRERLRRERGIPADKVVLLFVGKLIPKKDPALILSAITLMPKEKQDVIHLVVVGSGEMKDQLDALGRSTLGERYHSLGFLNQSEIGSAYALADVFVLPSREGAGETWGLVVNEAMFFGLPVVVSSGVGCHRDLVLEGKTGFTFRSGDAGECASAIAKIIQIGPTGRKTMGAESKAHVAAYSLEAAVAGLRRSIQIAGRGRIGRRAI
jgi:glycosyltransferase involved in cell wall biosynthesis